MTNIFKKILVPYDESDYSDKALEYTLDLKKIYKSKIFVLHIISSGMRYDLIGNDGNRTSLQLDNKMSVEEIEVFQSLKKQLKKFKARLDIKVVIATKSISAEIIDFAEKNNIDLIVMGSKGRTGFKKLLLGSVASDVIAYANCPIIVIK